MNEQKILAMPKKYFFGVLAVLILGIILGSFCDFNINVLLQNKTSIGAFFATYGSYLSYCLYPAAGTCLLLGLRKKGKHYETLGRILFVIAYFMAVYYSNNYNGSKVRELFGYSAKENPVFFLSVLSWMFWVVLYAWVPVVCSRIIDDSDADRLIAVGTTILVAGITSDNMNLWLKQVASRPRFKYLLTLEQPVSEFRQWWQMIPHLAGSNDNFKSWPSGNMTIAAMMFSLPLLSDVLKKRSDKTNLWCFIFACIYVGLYGYNRIHMTNHFLSDVCFGTLFCYLTYVLVDYGFCKAQSKG